VVKVIPFAMSFFSWRYLRFGAVVLILAVVVTVTFNGVFKEMERAVLHAQYHVRGESRIDSSVLIVYFDEDDIRSLGGMPLKRSYYALVISALNALGAKAIGVDVAFSEPNIEYPEYDSVLISVIRNAENVVLAGYFKSLDSSGGQVVDEGFQQFSLPQQQGFPPPVGMSGKNFVGPFPVLLAATNHLGHTNFGNDHELPLFIHYGVYVIPSLSFELARLGKQVQKADVHITSDAITARSSTGELSVSLDEGVLLLNYYGGLTSLNTLPALQLLKAYDAHVRALPSSISVEFVRNKLILFGIIAEGRSAFVPTPFSRQFPAIGIHAVAVSNMLQGTYLRRFSLLVEYIISLFLGLLAVISAYVKRESLGIGLIVVAVVFYVLSTFLAFSLWSFVLPVAKPIFVALATSVFLFVIRHQGVRQAVAKLEQQKESIALQLQEKERHLKLLEQELFESGGHSLPDVGSTLLDEIRKYKREVQRLTSQVADLQAYEFPVVSDWTVQTFEGIVYRTDGRMANAVDFVRKIAPNNASVLILGESGTGKELVARAIHRLSARKDHPFVAVNCGALPETLLESELFGHERGAFTGALKGKPGRFELANGGTIFLDEIGETTDAFQVKLLRVLQEGEFERVGGTATVKTDVRVIAATNKDLKRAVAEKTFREDLYYRLNTLTIQLPPLRERVDDIPALVEHFVSMEQAGIRVSANVMETFGMYEWKGNVRELQSAVKRAVIFARSDNRDIIRLKDLPEEFLSVSHGSFDIEEQIIASLREKGFSHSAISETAEELGGLHRGTVAEYFRGCCFKAFCEHGFNVEATVKSIAETSEDNVQTKVRKKILEYLTNAVELVRNDEPFEQVLLSSRPKFKNLPQRYHQYLEELLRSYHRREWRLDRK
jgi:transcriptional regulator with GAF, ATPase, and Fis domain/CHASE2 domain-containing sensor protein